MAMTVPADFDVRQFLPYLLNQAAEASSLEFQKVYKDKYGMLRNEWRVLFHLGIYGEMTASEIGARAQMHKTKISRAVQRLAERRYLTRNRATRDRRVEYLTLTVPGRKVYQDLKAIAADYDAALTEAMSHKDTAILRDLLARLALRT
ncbi:MAG: MarR family winged helix-turn-helix transcriptional regulator [Pseudomonadota bacterium]